MDLKSLRFGVEIETIRRSREAVAAAIQSVTGGNARCGTLPGNYNSWEVAVPDGRVWQVVSDGSLTSVPENLRAEIVTPILGYVDLSVLQEVVRAIRAGGSISDRSCSVHVHVDASDFSAEQLCNLAKLVFKQEPLIVRALGMQDRRLARYARPISPDFISRIERARPRTKEALNRAWYGHFNQAPDRYHPSRYSLLNLNSVFFRGTIEIRAFEGTLHAGKIKAWVQFALALAARGLSARATASRKREFDPGSAKYDFRVFLLRLGLVGEEFKTARKHLLGLMPGDAAFKRGRPPKSGSGSFGSLVAPKPPIINPEEPGSTPPQEFLSPSPEMRSQLRPEDSCDE